MNYPNYYGSNLFNQNNGLMQPLQNLGNQNQQQMQSNLNWVQGEAGARAWLVAPGNTVLLMDSERQQFYIKSANESGMPSMRVYEYKEVANQLPNNTQSNSDFVSKQEFEELKARIDTLEHPEVPKIEKKRGKTNDESAE